MFRPNQPCLVMPVQGTDVYAQPVFAPAVTEHCAVVKLDSKALRTQARGEASASRGTAFEQQEAAVLLMSSSTAANLDSIVQLPGGLQLRVIGSAPQFNILGILDHYEVSLSFWGYAS